ncbi:hypothetical protein HYC85_028828 [Camellia sinensis]|uniref:Uncharacterized protein n=1 Tax=Camellia sinensis TaxID=4442 RepID=A0A7J7FWZ2_CAMSI|nr:hypothetical protein HYC85_028828 [Camellia sinensis]
MALSLERVRIHEPRDLLGSGLEKKSEALGLERIRIHESRDPKHLDSNGFKRNLEVASLMSPRTLAGSELSGIYAPEPWALLKNLSLSSYSREFEIVLQGSSKIFEFSNSFLEPPSYIFGDSAGEADWLMVSTRSGIHTTPTRMAGEDEVH